MTEHPYIVFIRRRQVGENGRQMKLSPVGYFIRLDQISTLPDIPSLPVDGNSGFNFSFFVLRTRECFVERRRFRFANGQIVLR